MKLSTMLLIAALGTASTVALGADAISAADFTKKAGEAGVAEVEMGKLGAAKASNADVKAFAQKMVADHTKANKELAAVAKAKGLEVPTEPGLIHKGMKEKFEHQSASIRGRGLQSRLHATDGAGSQVSGRAVPDSGQRHDAGSGLTRVGEEDAADSSAASRRCADTGSEARLEVKFPRAVSLLPCLAVRTIDRLRLRRSALP